MTARRSVIGAVVAAIAITAAGCASETGSASNPTGPVSVPPRTESPSATSGIVAPSPSVIKPPIAVDGMAPVVGRVRTSDRVVFITIDDGGVEEPKTARLLERTKLPVTSFLTKKYVQGNPGFYQQISEADGQVIQNHTLTHPQLPTLSLAGQRAEICGDSAALSQWYGNQPWLLRPPFGESNEVTQKAARACGIDYLVLWTVNMPSGGHGNLQYAEGNRLVPGDIILAHWRQDLNKDLKRALGNIAHQGFKVAALQDYLPKR